MLTSTSQRNTQNRELLEAIELLSVRVGIHALMTSKPIHCGAGRRGGGGPGRRESYQEEVYPLIFS